MLASAAPTASLITEQPALKLWLILAETTALSAPAASVTYYLIGTNGIRLGYAIARRIAGGYKTDFGCSVAKLIEDLRMSTYKMLAARNLFRNLRPRVSHASAILRRRSQSDDLTRLASSRHRSAYCRHDDGIVVDPAGSGRIP
jgi:hypothetical protein